MYEWKVEVEEKHSVVVLKKIQKVMRQNLPWRNLPLFSSRLGAQKKNRMGAVFWGFKPETLKYISCVFIEEKVCFEMEIYQSALSYWNLQSKSSWC